jgi:hypothetical protein
LVLGFWSFEMSNSSLIHTRLQPGVKLVHEWKPF